jgi:hypothetical protein
MQWIKQTMLAKENNISPDDLDLLFITDHADEVVKHISAFYTTSHLRPNF